MRLTVWTKAITFGSRFRIGMLLALGLIYTNAALGDGRLFPGAQYPVASSPRSLVVGDLNGDEVPDLAVANVGFHDVLSVLLGVGDGTFAGAVHYDAGDVPIFVAMPIEHP